ncbi:phosphoribosylaminoimidazolesuccinocarboxamide synthase [Actinomycetaceae bacterium MB13-C1-2]|nr:phosphoribosylaminoimidazolesuccinocarboxamide synthase [Actinomycetaceae bacterium MB13-C1-2]
MAQKGQLLYEGKAKKLYETDSPEVLWVEYCDQATAFNGEKKDQIPGKGKLNNQISGMIFDLLADAGVPSHYLGSLSETEHLAQKVQIIPLEVVVRNVAAGSLCKRLGLMEGTALPDPIVELFYKDDDLGDPLITDEHVKILNLASEAEVAEIKEKALTVNAALTEIFEKCGIRLVDFKLEFGRDAEGNVLLADEVSPDTCRLWDAATDEHLDKDVYRRDIGDLTSVYQVVLARLQELTAKRG